MKEHILKSFYQGRDEEFFGAGNCASVALIKAAIYTFEKEVFQLSETEGHYKVTLLNGELVSFSDDELAYATGASSFILGKTDDAATKAIYEDIRAYAFICFTVICKMAQRYGDYSSRFSKFIIPEDFETAVEIINDGTFTPEVYEFLGLEDHVTPTYRFNLNRRINNGSATVLWTKYHAMFAVNDYYDLYGKKKRFRGRVMPKVPGRIGAGVFQIKGH